MSLLDKDVLIEIINESKNKNGTINWKESVKKLNEEFGIDKGKGFYRSHYRRATGDESYFKGSTQFKPVLMKEDVPNAPIKRISVETGANGTQKSEILVNIMEHPLKTPNEIMLLHGYDITMWELANHKMKIWNTYSKQDGTSELYSSALTVKPIAGFDITEEAFETLIDNIIQKYRMDNKYIERYQFSEFEHRYMFEMNIFDLHLGKLAWNGETGEDYDLSIATERFQYAVDDLLNEATFMNVEKILLPIGNDFFHVDNDHNTTTKGTPQDVDTRIGKIFERGIDLMIETIMKCINVADTEIVFVPSNHDAMIGYFMAVTIKKLFEKHPNVTLQMSPYPRKYVRYKNNLIGFTHGDKEKKNLLTLMQAEVPQLWAVSDFREWHLGHLHSKHKEEHNGFDIERMPSLTGTDKYHTEYGWMGNHKRAIGKFWSHKGGVRWEIQSYLKKK